jgi:hypothetical protein
MCGRPDVRQYMIPSDGRFPRPPANSPCLHAHRGVDASVRHVRHPLVRLDSTRPIHSPCPQYAVRHVRQPPTHRASFPSARVVPPSLPCTLDSPNSMEHVQHKTLESNIRLIQMKHSENTLATYM